METFIRLIPRPSARPLLRPPLNNLQPLPEVSPCLLGTYETNFYHYWKKKVSKFPCRNWFPWLSSRIASSTSEVTLRPSSIASRANAVNPTWRHSNPDSHYGFRQPPAAGRYQLPTSGTTPADLSHYSAIPSGIYTIFSTIFFCCLFPMQRRERL